MWFLYTVCNVHVSCYAVTCLHLRPLQSLLRLIISVIIPYDTNMLLGYLFLLDIYTFQSVCSVCCLKNLAPDCSLDLRWTNFLKVSLC
jgi:hypothetical protein